MFFTSGRILACFIFLWTRADAWSNCWLWGRFGFLHWYIRLESRTVSIFLNFCTFLIGPAVLSGVRTVWETLWRHFGFPKFLHFPNIDKYSLAHETIINLKCVVLCWLHKGPRKSQLHRQKLFRVFLFSKILACFIFLCARGDAWSNCSLWDRFGFRHDRSLFSAF